ncbi:MAG: hypothetical protein M5U28_17100 [Sandaracinaceae bacterium]|nr:hypothetical protein [Sandaracinaceae bacterium]
MVQASALRFRVGAPPAPGQRDGVDGHAEEGERLERAEDAADHQPVARRADVVVVVAGPEDPGEERQAHDDVEPLLHDLAVDAGELDQQVAEDRAEDQLPDALHPEVHHPPAPVGVERLVDRRDHARQVEQRRHQQAEEEHHRGGGLPLALPDRPADVGDEEEHVDHHEVVEGPRDLEELAALPPVEVEADDRRDADDDERDELHVGQLRPGQLPVALVGHDVVRGAHEAGEQPHHEEVRVGGARGVEGIQSWSPSRPACAKPMMNP